MISVGRCVCVVTVILCLLVCYSVRLRLKGLQFIIFCVKLNQNQDRLAKKTVANNCGPTLPQKTTPGTNDQNLTITLTLTLTPETRGFLFGELL